MHKCIFDGMIANIKRFAEEVFSGKDEDFKSRLLDELELITKMGTKTKRSPTDDLNPNTNKKLKIDPKRKVLYRNFHDIDGTIFLVEISRNILKVFILLFPNFEAPDIFLSEIMSEKKAQKLMTESMNMFEELVKKFHIKYGKLQISGYHGLP